MDIEDRLYLCEECCPRQEDWLLQCQALKSSG